MNDNRLKSTNDYYGPLNSTSLYRKKYGKPKSIIIGDWNASQTRIFYKSQLPHSLTIKDSMNLTLSDRAKLAFESRHALRLYSRERSPLITRILAQLYDGIRHMKTFGYWSSTGMNYEEVKMKYRIEAKKKLDSNANEELIESYMYNRIIERSCVTNKLFDEIAETGLSYNKFKRIINRLAKHKPIKHEKKPPPPPNTYEI